MAEEAKWYVVHTYSGYENKVKEGIEKTVGNRNMQDQIFEVQVPLEDSVEEKNGKQVVVQRKVFPGYVLINMIMNDDTWYVVRNTRGVTGFVVGDDAFTADAGPFVTAATAIDISACERDAAGVTEFWAAREREEVRLAVSALSSARETHLAVEEFFVAAMDFSVTENIADRLTAEIFG